MSQPDALLEDLTPADRNLLDRELNRGIIKATALFVPVVLAAIVAIYLVNSHYRKHFNDNFLGFINLFLVVIGAFAGRMYVGHCISFFKDKNAFQKRVYRGIVTGKENGRVKINSHELKIGKSYYDQLREGEKVEVHLSVRTGIVLDIKRI